MAARVRGDAHRLETIAADVAGFAFRAKAAFMMIVGLVAAVTAHRQPRGRRWLGMTAVAAEPGMAAAQRKPRAAMVEPRPGPARGCVTGLASRRRAEPALVRDVGVAAHTGYPGGTILLILVTIGTGSVDMRAGQREACCGVTKARRGPPAVLQVARRAIAPQIALMRVLTDMARGAFARRFKAVHGFDVAGGAAHTLVRPDQGETRRLVVIENRPFPARRRMAGRAIAAIIPLVDVVLAMTGGALHRRAQPLVLRAMAGSAGDRAMLSDERKARPPMIEQGAFPAQLGVAAGAVGTVAALVDIVGQVARDALSRRSGEAIADMAIGASGHLMRADQLKAGRGVIELMDDLPATFAVAAGAILAEAGLMDVVFDMAGNAGSRRGTKLHFGLVAIRAGQSAMLAVDRKVGLAMVEARAFEVHRKFDGTLMLEMADSALLFRCRWHAAVKAGARTNIAGDAGMAGLALAVLGRRREGIMAGAAARVDFLMRGAKRAGANQPFKRRAQGQQSPEHRQQHQRADKDLGPGHQYMWTARTCSATVIARNRNSGTCR